MFDSIYLNDRIAEAVAAHPKAVSLNDSEFKSLYDSERKHFAGACRKAGLKPTGRSVKLDPVTSPNAKSRRVQVWAKRS